MIDVEIARRKLLEATPIACRNEEVVNFDTAEIPWWAWVRRFHLPEVSGGSSRRCVGARQRAGALAARGLLLRRRLLPDGGGGLACPTACAPQPVPHSLCATSWKGLRWDPGAARPLPARRAADPRRPNLPTQAEKLNGRAAMVGYVLAGLVDLLTGSGLVDQQESFLGKLVLHITVFGVLLIRSTADIDKFKGLIDEATFYDRQWTAGRAKPEETEM